MMEKLIDHLLRTTRVLIRKIVRKYLKNHKNHMVLYSRLLMRLQKVLVTPIHNKIIIILD